MLRGVCAGEAGPGGPGEQPQCFALVYNQEISEGMCVMLCARYVCTLHVLCVCMLCYMCLLCMITCLHYVCYTCVFYMSMHVTHVLCVDSVLGSYAYVLF